MKKRKTKNREPSGRRETTKHYLRAGALAGITNNKTAQGYKRSIDYFAEWAKARGLGRIANVPADEKGRAAIIQEYAQHLAKEGKSPSTVHTYLAPVCVGFGVKMKEIEKSRRTADAISRGRSQVIGEDGLPLINRQGAAEEKMEKFRRLALFNQAVGIRRGELAKLYGRDLVRDESGYLCVKVEKGKGGKVQLQRILGDQEEFVRSIFEGIGPDQLVFSKGEMSNHINFHGMRAKLAQNAYELYKKRLQEEPGYREQLIQEIEARWKEYNPKKEDKEAFEKFSKALRNPRPYKIKRSNVTVARRDGKAEEYDRLSLFAVSVFHLSHWRLDVTVVNYMLADVG